MDAFHQRLVFRWTWLIVAGILAVLLQGGCASLAASSPRTIKFSGYTWTVRSSTELVGPGPNYFSDDPADVFVDSKGSLHMKIVQRGGKWYSTEVIGDLPLDYGSYTWVVSSPLDTLGQSGVLGLFTWDDQAKDVHYREIDIEVSHFKEASEENAQFVVQPYDTPGNRYRFKMPLKHISAHRLDWNPTRVKFDSWEDALHVTWTFVRPAGIPPAGKGNPHINLWLYKGTPPKDGKNIEVVIQSFTFRKSPPQPTPTQPKNR